MRPLLRLSLPLAFLFVLAGCDTAEDVNGGDTFPLTSERPAGFTYEFGMLDDGSTVSGSETETSEDLINDDRFGPADVASATIQSMSVELNMDLPLGNENEIVIESAMLTLSAAGVEDEVVALGSDFSLVINTTNANLRRAPLDIEDADITEFLQEETFTGTLMLDVGEAGDGSYQFTVTFDVEIEVFA